MWVKHLDDFTERQTIRALGPLGIAADLAAKCYANRNRTDGFIPHAVAHNLLTYSIAREDGTVFHLCAKTKKGTVSIDGELVIELTVEAGLWDVALGGYQIRHYHDEQPTAEHAQEVSEKDAAAGGNGDRLKQRTKQMPSTLLAYCQANR